jgi:hypothetical protein
LIHLIDSTPDEVAHHRGEVTKEEKQTQGDEKKRQTPKSETDLLT